LDISIDTNGPKYEQWNKTLCHIVNIFSMKHWAFHYKSNMFALLAKNNINANTRCITFNFKNFLETR
jgi:hypothetical protein